MEDTNPKIMFLLFKIRYSNDINDEYFITNDQK